MPEHLRALVVILGVSVVTFLCAQRPAVEMGMASEDFKRRRNLWLAITLIAFTSHNFWIFAAGTVLVLMVAAPRDSNRLALYFFLIFAIPPFSAPIPGLGVFNQLFLLNYPRLLSLLILLPCYLVLRADPTTPRFGRHGADWFLAGYLVLQLILQYASGTFTNMLRYSLYAFLDAFLPYYVASRYLRTADHFRDALLAFVLAAVVMASIACFEYVKHWLLYNNLSYAMGIPWTAGSYLGRGGSLRALATTGQSIVLGYVMMVAILLHCGLRMASNKAGAWWLGMATLICGVIVPLARGPWVGVAVGMLVLAVSGPRPITRLLRVVGVGFLLGPALLLSPLGPSIIEYLPFIGSVDHSNIVYRQRLFEISVNLIAQSPLFGVPNFMMDPAMQELDQGLGFIDVVNSYIAVALSYGVIGLSLFAGVFVCAVWGLVSALFVQADKTTERHLQGRALLAAMIAIMVTIATVSSISFIPLVYWCVSGLAVAYARMAVVGESDASNFPPSMSGPWPTARPVGHIGLPRARP